MMSILAKSRLADYFAHSIDELVATIVRWWLPISVERPPLDSGRVNSEAESSARSPVSGLRFARGAIDDFALTYALFFSGLPTLKWVSLPSASS